ncbi:hypothetical protein [Flavobacterium chungangense]|uniref:Lipoprotein n=1 Tax=Flavobacterium chungangense TaxID=554283 RepID=A0A6V6Z3Y1_9FLAO|nr:hypothetical protein [Flavobacterium chungangense]CAD0006463.1 hypothetical protein FLACHUCJ7_02836 [Flavobacterium chungangense]
MKNKLLALAAFFALISCKKEFKVNDSFREEILSKVHIQKDTLVVFNTLLDSLDQKKISFCEYFNYSHYALSDSCTLILDKKYEVRLGNYSPEYFEEHHKMLSNAIKNYEKRLGIDENSARIGEYIEVTNDIIKNYCINQDKK